MFNNYYGNMMYGYGGYGAFAWLLPFMPLVLIWSLCWKGLGLWHAAQRKQGWWFAAILVFNTMGLLEIIYLFGVLKLKSEEVFPFLKK
ncbi:MAG: hypothetical protein RLZZ324_808 [Candidatus Parcubacteria bacterium]|jgi:hypothetical protein